MKALIATTSMILIGTVSAWADFSYGVDVIPTIHEIRFRTWMRKYGKSYTSKEEYRFRFAQYYKSAQYVDHHNMLTQASHKLSLNELADITDDEWIKELPPIKAKNHSLPTLKSNCSASDICDLPQSKDWRKEGYITAVKQTPQGCHGASYAFAAADTVEATYYNSTKQILNMSAKQMMDCGAVQDPKFEMNGCAYGDTEQAFKYIQHGYKLMSEADYPFTNDNSCKYDASKGKGGLSNIYAVQVLPNDVKQALQYGPVATVVNSGAKAFKFYTNGIITDPSKCDYKNIDLYVLIVGYGVENGQGYFIVKNNWGTGWGEDGYARISDSDKNVCGILSNNWMFQITQ